MRKISRAEEQYNSLNFRTADADEGEKCMSPNGVSYESAAATGGRTTCGRPAVGYGFNKKPTCGGKTCARIEYTHYLGSVKPWGQEEHFRVVDSDTPLTEGGPKCEGCGGKMQEHGEGSVCRNRRCNKRDMVINASKTASDKPWDEEDFDGKYATEKEASLADMAHNVVTHLPTVIPAVAAEAAAVTGLVKTIKKNRNKPAPPTGSDEAYNATGFMSPSQVQNYKNKDVVEKNSSFNERYAKEASVSEALGLLTPAAIVAQPFIMDKINKHNDKKRKQKEPEEQKEPEDFDGKYATEKEASVEFNERYANRFNTYKGEEASSLIDEHQSFIDHHYEQIMKPGHPVQSDSGKSLEDPAIEQRNKDHFTAAGAHIEVIKAIQSGKSKNKIDLLSTRAKMTSHRAGTFPGQHGGIITTPPDTQMSDTEYQEHIKKFPFKAAMMANKHGNVEHTCDVGDHKVHEDVRCVTPDCEHRGKSWESDGHQDWDHDYACGEHFTEGTTAGIAKNHDDDSDWRNRYSDLDSDW